LNIVNLKKPPDWIQEYSFFGLLRECLDNETNNEKILREEMMEHHRRHDALEVLDCTPLLAV